MRPMKSSGELTHARGITHSVLAKWALAMFLLMGVYDLIQSFFNAALTTLEQHLDARSLRI